MQEYKTYEIYIFLELRSKEHDFREHRPPKSSVIRLSKLISSRPLNFPLSGRFIKITAVSLVSLPRKYLL